MLLFLLAKKAEDNRVHNYKQAYSIWQAIRQFHRYTHPVKFNNDRNSHMVYNKQR